MVHCAACGVVPVPLSELPVELPDDVSFDQPGNPLDNHPDWRHVACPKRGAEAARDTDTMDTFVDSSWYHARFCSPRAESPVERGAVDGGGGTGRLPVRIWGHGSYSNFSSSYLVGGQDRRFGGGNLRIPIGGDNRG